MYTLGKRGQTEALQVCEDVTLLSGAKVVLCSCVEENMMTVALCAQLVAPTAAVLVFGVVCVRDDIGEIDICLLSSSQGSAGLFRCLANTCLWQLMLACNFISWSASKGDHEVMVREGVSRE